LKVYLEGHDDDEEQEGMLPAMKVNEKLLNNYITATERYSRPPARYTEASLVKKLEELGIGRPSTYAPTISTIINRNYVRKEILMVTKEIIPNLRYRQTKREVIKRKYGV
jgi:DNA topoisomerase-1